MQIEISNYTKKIKKNILLDNINIKEIIVPKDSINIYTLEWYWEDDDKNDTKIGEQEENQYYTLNLEINAKEYLKQ